ncbi:MAG: glycerophosphodiester phosphodiesterase family protein [Chloroflexota bacterium]
MSTPPPLHFDVASVHPESVFYAPDGRLVQFKVHSANWDPALPENSLDALAACLKAPVARAEIDLVPLADRDFLLYHDSVLDRGSTGSGRVADLTSDAARSLRLRAYRHDDAPDELPPPTEHPLSQLSDVVALMLATPAPTVLQLDMKDARPWPWARIEELLRMVEPIRSRVIFGCNADWNLRRVLQVDSTAPIGFDPLYYLDWAPDDAQIGRLPGARGAYGYLDTHPLARERHGSTADYLRDRLGGLLRLVPNPRDLYIRLRTAERMVADDLGLDTLKDMIHDLGASFDLWTLDAGTPNWEARFQLAIALGADVVTTNTPRALFASLRS